MAVKVNTIDLDTIRQHYVCANCWGNLFPTFQGDRSATGAHIYQLACHTPECPCRGFVSKHHVEATETQAVDERYKLWHALKTVLPWVRERGPEKKWDGQWDADKETYISNTPKLTLAEMNALIGF